MRGSDIVWGVSREGVGAVLRRSEGALLYGFVGYTFWLRIPTATLLNKQFVHGFAGYTFWLGRPRVAFLSRPFVYAFVG